MPVKTETAPAEREAMMRCLICGGAADLNRFHKSIPIFRCTDRDCGFRFFDLSKWHYPYSDVDYYDSWQANTFNVSAPWLEARVGLVKRFMSHGKVAELGCGIGETAVALHSVGYDVIGVEESKRAIDFLRQSYPEIEWSNANVLDFLAGADAMSLDAITMFHVLEHIPYPMRTIELIDRSLRPDGIVVVEVPDVGGGFARLKGARWEYYLEHHVNYFDVRSLTKLFGQFGFHLSYMEPTYHFSFPQGDVLKDTMKGMLARLGLNSIIRTVWARH